MAGVGFNAAIRIVPRASRRLDLLLAASHLAIALLALWVFALAPYGLLLVAATIVHWGAWQAERQGAVAAGEALLFDADGAWWIQRPDGQRLAARLDGPPLVTPWLMVLPLRSDDGRWRRRLFLLSDNLPAEDFRRLRVRLLWSAAPLRS